MALEEGMCSANTVVDVQLRRRAETDVVENLNRYLDPASRRYLQPEPLMSQPGYFGFVALKYGTRPNLYGYAFDNPVGFFDPNGREVFAADPTSAALLAQLQQNATGAAFYNYLNASPFIYNVSSALLPAYLQREDPFGLFSPGIATGKSACNDGGNITLYNLEVLASNRDPVANLAHELTHAGLFDLQYLGRPGAPDVITTFAPDSSNGGLPYLPHTLMEAYWQGMFRGTP